MPWTDPGGPSSETRVYGRVPSYDDMLRRADTHEWGNAKGGPLKGVSNHNTNAAFLVYSPLGSAT